MGKTATRGKIGTRRITGATLAEVLMVTMILAVILGGISAIYFASMRYWTRGATEHYAQQKASWVVQRIAPDVREGLSVIPGTAPFELSYIAIRMPSKTYDSGEQAYLNQLSVDGTGMPYLVAGGWVLYYRGNENGTITLNGDKLWRLALDENGNTIHQYVVADNLVDNPLDESGNPKPVFRYWPDVYRLRSVEVTVTVEERIGTRTSQATMTSEMTLRNN